ncbi:hypothetical protein PTSG_04728 [Salpingoeca rosetta]|uniref:Uncharacterized protein n=1 Tax=Salpingoeca rosetta (strain ATCC 50818 / BSB-021) TaxID=946362 RepID=F2U9J2_SALR5|nr:uncharacterized protein PTSG_04728 [Salpingoeca rosetta]EGD73019.1 hypothetical protein PTSG_04728 [Salpingoeca rosetta]|eukprot:XP_004994050.1 hypothetical protein PTSG_04728 [Salpingoeca rosetta]
MARRRLAHRLLQQQQRALKRAMGGAQSLVWVATLSLCVVVLLAEHGAGVLAASAPDEAGLEGGRALQALSSLSSLTTAPATATTTTMVQIGVQPLLQRVSSPLTTTTRTTTTTSTTTTRTTTTSTTYTLAQFAGHTQAVNVTTPAAKSSTTEKLVMSLTTRPLVTTTLPFQGDGSGSGSSGSGSGGGSGHDSSVATQRTTTTPLPTQTPVPRGGLSTATATVPTNCPEGSCQTTSTVETTTTTTATAATAATTTTTMMTTTMMMMATATATATTTTRMQTVMPSTVSMQDGTDGDDAASSPSAHSFLGVAIGISIASLIVGVLTLATILWRSRAGRHKATAITTPAMQALAIAAGEGEPPRPPVQTKGGPPSTPAPLAPPPYSLPGDVHTFATAPSSFLPEGNTDATAESWGFEPPSPGNSLLEAQYARTLAHGGGEGCIDVDDGHGPSGVLPFLGIDELDTLDFTHRSCEQVQLPLQTLNASIGTFALHTEHGNLGEQQQPHSYQDHGLLRADMTAEVMDTDVDRAGCHRSHITAISSRTYSSGGDGSSGSGGSSDHPSSDQDGDEELSSSLSLASSFSNDTFSVVVHPTTIAVAIINNDMRTLRALVHHEKVPDVQWCADNKETLLHLAVRVGNVETTQWLVRHGADVNAQSENGNTSLHIAVAQGHVEIVSYLCAQPSCDIRVQNSLGQDALILSVIYGNPRCIEVIPIRNQAYDFDEQRDIHRRNALHWAAAMNDSLSFHILLGCGADLSLRARHGDTVVHIAARGNAVLVLEVIRQSLKPIEVRGFTKSPNYTGMTPLQVAEAKDCLEAAAWLRYYTEAPLSNFSTQHASSCFSGNAATSIHPGAIDHLTFRHDNANAESSADC